jgi:4-hydroxy-tetrahydrodipicolinate synthase
VQRLTAAGVDAITALGSTGSYAYLDRGERRLVAETAVQAAGGTPVMVGIGALRTSQVQALADDAQKVGASAVLLAPMSYQALTEDEVFGLYEDVTAGLSVPLVVYDNPGTTRFTFSDELYARIATLPHVASIKIPGLPARARERVEQIRSLVPGHVSIGISGDSGAATALAAGCELWYSVIGGTLPALALSVTRAVQAGNVRAADAEMARLGPLWNLFAAHGSLRVTAAIAEHLKLVPHESLPRPVRGLEKDARRQVAQLVDELGLRD